MIRNTSTDAYKYIQQNGLLGRRQWQVYDVLFRYGPLTAGECCELIKQYHAPHAQLNSVSPRFDEMKSRGVIIEVGERVCRVTNRKVLEWDVTANYPSAISKAVSPPRPNIHDLNCAFPELVSVANHYKQYNLSMGPALEKILEYLPHAIARGRW